MMAQPAAARCAEYAGAAPALHSSLKRSELTTLLQSQQVVFHSAPRTRQQRQCRNRLHRMSVSAGKAAGPDPSDGSGSSASLREQVGVHLRCCNHVTTAASSPQLLLRRQCITCAVLSMLFRQNNWTGCFSRALLSAADQRKLTAEQ